MQLIVFRGQTDIRPTSNKSALLSSANAWTLANWDPGTPIDLAAATTNATTTLLSSKLDSIVGSGRWTDDNAPDPSDRISRYEWLAFFDLFGPPVIRSGSFGAPVARREATHAFDLSRWSTRPCVVVIGVLRDEAGQDLPLPVGVSTNGRQREPVVAGTTVVRWVYPLPADPPRIPITEPADAPTDPTDDPARNQG